jgi:glyoxylase-like metal-dependent hydrolase (beta-lactamase superfamily II)
MREVMPGLFCIDLYVPRAGFKDFITAWLIRDDERRRTVLIETGPASAVPSLIDDLKRAGVSEIDYLLYTHIHMDHSGGAGQFIKSYPSVKIAVPTKGRKHLVSPEALFKGSIVALGRDLIEAYGEPKAVTEDMLVKLPFSIDGLTVIETPGHSPHHDSYIYELGGCNILFAGEAAGYYEEFEDGSAYSRPATPDRFFYDKALDSLEKLRRQADCADMVCFPHRGFTFEVAPVLERAERQMRLWKDIIFSLSPASSPKDCVDELKINDPFMTHSDKLSAEARSREDFFLEKSAAGYLGYLFP